MITKNVNIAGLTFMKKMIPLNVKNNIYNKYGPL